MSENRITIAYEGKVSPKDVSALVNNFAALVEILSRDVAHAADIDWEVEKIQGGSASLTFAGTHVHPHKVQTVVRAWQVIGESVQRGEQVPYPDKIKKHIDGITHQLNGRVTAAHFKTGKHFFEIQSADVVPQLPSTGSHTALGSVKGRVQAISTRKNLRLTLFDHLFDKAVTCHFESDMKTKTELLGYLDKDVLVAGRVTRDARTGHAKSIREVTSIEEVRRVEPDAYKKTRGALSWMGDEPAEKLIRQLRDG